MRDEASRPRGDLKRHQIWQSLDGEFTMSIRISFAFADDFSRVSHRPRGPGVMSWLRAGAARWRERRMLEELDDRALRDIGISRSQALVEATKPFWRP